jgi:hypothetical protein
MENDLVLVLLFELTPELCVKQLQFGHDERTLYPLGHEMGVDGRVRRHGHQLVDESQCSVKAVSLVRTENESVLILRHAYLSPENLAGS